jgi:signal transduction histidine kinase
VKFTEAGEVRMELEATDRAVLLRVADTGIGIAAEHAEHVFEAFWQVDQTDGRVGGTGLGLAVTQQLAGLLEGEVTLEAGTGGGSVFTLRLPRYAPELGEAAQEAPPEPGAAEKRVRGRRYETRRGSKGPPTGPPKG